MIQMTENEFEKFKKARKTKVIKEEAGEDLGALILRLEKVTEKLKHEVRQCQATANKAISEIEELKRRLTNE